MSPALYDYILSMQLTTREREICEAFATIGKEGYTIRELAKRMGISYRVLIRHRERAMKRNGYTSWIGFITDFTREMQKEN